MSKARKILAALLIFVSAGFTFAQKPAEPKLKVVKVFFHFIGSEGSESKILPLRRKVSADAPLRSAIEEMIREPTAAEQKLGYGSASYGDMKLVSVKLKKGTARIDLRRTITNDFNPGELQTFAFESAVIKTAKQFPAVKRVIVCVNGINEFGIGLVEDAPRPCPKEN